MLSIVFLLVAPYLYTAELVKCSLISREFVTIVQKAKLQRRFLLKKQSSEWKAQALHNKAAFENKRNRIPLAEQKQLDKAFRKLIRRELQLSQIQDSCEHILLHNVRFMTKLMGLHEQGACWFRIMTIDS